MALVIDAYSHRVVGYDLSTSLAIGEGVQRALKMASRSVSWPHRLMHHSDRGIQYCSGTYVRMLESQGVKVSIIEQSHVYENALAETVIGILKTQFLLCEKLISIRVAKRLTSESINVYNER